MSFAGTLGSMFVAHDGLGTVVAMGAWCGAYAGLHEALYALSKVLFPPETDEAREDDDAPQASCPTTTTNGGVGGCREGHPAAEGSRSASQNGGAKRTKAKRLDLDAPQSKYFGTSLRRVATARCVALVHAVVSWGWSVRTLVAAWPALRSPTARGAAELLDAATPGSFFFSPAGAGNSTWSAAGEQSVMRWTAKLAYDAARGSSETAFMRHSLGYFVQELAHVVAREPDPVFVAHHLLYLGATFPVCALTRRGWPMIAVATALAEVTNPLQLAWEMAKASECFEAYDALSLPFTAFFTLVRGIAMPVCFADMAHFLFFGSRSSSASYGDDERLARRVLVWTFSLFAGGIAASILWLAMLVRGFVRYRRKKKKHHQASGSAPSSKKTKAA